jgi:hypothetical protein
MRFFDGGVIPMKGQVLLDEAYRWHNVGVADDHDLAADRGQAGVDGSRPAAIGLNQKPESFVAAGYDRRCRRLGAVVDDDHFEWHVRPLRWKSVENLLQQVQPVKHGHDNRSNRLQHAYVWPPRKD